MAALATISGIMHDRVYDDKMRELFDNTRDIDNPLSLHEIASMYYKNDQFYDEIMWFVNEFGVHNMEGKWIFYSPALLERWCRHIYDTHPDKAKYCNIQKFVEHTARAGSAGSVVMFNRSTIVNMLDGGDPIYVGLGAALRVPIGDISEYMFIKYDRCAPHFQCIEPRDLRQPTQQPNGTIKYPVSHFTTITSYVANICGPVAKDYYNWINTKRIEILMNNTSQSREGIRRSRSSIPTAAPPAIVPSAPVAPILPHNVNVGVPGTVTAIYNSDTLDSKLIQLQVMIEASTCSRKEKLAILIHIMDIRQNI
jgi:hypothetical protein